MGGETVHALRDVSLSVEAGEFVAIIGSSGSGKTTLMNILGLLDQPTEGQYRLDGRSVEAIPDDERALIRNQKLGFVFQSFHLLPRMTALRNVELPLVYSASYDLEFSHEKSTAAAKRALEKVHLSDREHHRPNELSGGQRQRVAIARALVNRPRLLMADEPTGNLDSKTSAEILDLFADLNEREKVTVILVTHDPKIAARARRVVTMSDGRVESDART